MFFELDGLGHIPFESCTQRSIKIKLLTQIQALIFQSQEGLVRTNWVLLIRETSLLMENFLYLSNSAVYILEHVEVLIG